MHKPIGREFEVACEVLSADRNIGIRLYQGPKSTHFQKVIIDRFRPANKSEADASSSLFQELKSDNDSLELLTILLPAANELKDLKGSAQLAQNLGYRYQEEEVSDASGIVTRESLTFPSVTRLNEVLEAYLPDSVRFAEFDGGLYPPTRFVRRFVEKGEVLVAKEQPYSYHDHVALHVLGWIGLGGAFSDYLRKTLTPYVERSRAERRLPPVPNLDQSGVAAYFNPSGQLVKRVMPVLDSLSTEIAFAAFKASDPRKDISDRLSLLSLGGSFEGNMPQIWLSDSDLGAKLQAEDVIERFKILTEAPAA